MVTLFIWLLNHLNDNITNSNKLTMQLSCCMEAHMTGPTKHRTVSHRTVRVRFWVRVRVRVNRTGPHRTSDAVQCGVSSEPTWLVCVIKRLCVCTVQAASTSWRAGEPTCNQILTNSTTVANTSATTSTSTAAVVVIGHCVLTLIITVIVTLIIISVVGLWHAVVNTYIVQYSTSCYNLGTSGWRGLQTTTRSVQTAKSQLQ